MSDLEILLLGPLRVAVDGRPVTSFEADTARALLAYLAVHPDGAFQRETLAGLLWPERPEALALQNLRQALSRLRRVIGDAEADPPYLLVSRESIQLNPEARWQVDVVAFDAVLASTRTHAHRRLGTCPLCVECLRQAVELYRGEFMAGFSLASAPYEEWMVTQRENLHIQGLDALHTLAACHEERGELQAAAQAAERARALREAQAEG